MTILPFLLLLAGLTTPQTQFLGLLLPLWVAVPGRVNALSFSRYSGLNERTFRRWMAKALPWHRLCVTLLHILMGCGAINRHLILTIDAAFIPKAGRCMTTPIRVAFVQHSYSRTSPGHRFHALPSG